MPKKTKLKKIISALSPDVTSVDFQNFDSEINKLKQSLKQKVQIATLDDVNNQIDKFRKSIDLAPLSKSIDNIRQSIDERIQYIADTIEEKSAELEASMTTKADAQQAFNLTNEVNNLRETLFKLDTLKNTDIQSLKDELVKAQKIEPNLNKVIKDIQDTLSYVSIETANNSKEISGSTKELKGFEDKLNKLRIDLNTRISNIGGGAMNRQMFIGGVDPLTRYTDMNLKAGSNVTITYANNNTTKKVDVTFSASGTGGGTVRSVNSISTSQTAGSTSGTDYVYLCSGTMTLTMPDATGNTNLYTVKNVGNGIITINTTSAQLIDNQASIQLATIYTSVDLISDTANWNLT